MEIVLPLITEELVSQGPAYLLAGIFGYGWWSSAKEAKNRETALYEKIIATTPQLIEATNTLRDALMYVNRQSGSRV